VEEKFQDTAEPPKNNPTNPLSLTASKKKTGEWVVDEDYTPQRHTPQREKKGRKDGGRRGKAK